jgi:hypothetical protein
MKKISLLFRAAFVISMIFIVSGCAATRVTSEWTEPEIKEAPFQKVMVMAITKQEGTRRNFEDAFVAELGSQGIASYPYIETEGKKVPRKVVGEAVKKTDADAVLTVSLVKVKSEQNVVPNYSRSSFYDGYYSAWNRAYDPVTVYEYDVVVFEVNLYDVKSEKLVWTLTTQNIDRGDLDQQLVPYAKTVTSRLRKRGLI